MTNSLLLKTFEYKTWADSRTFEAALHLEHINNQLLRFVTQQFNHMAIVEEMFRARLLGAASPHGSTNTDALPSLGE